MLVSEGLRAAGGIVEQEVIASRAAWPAIANGLPPRLSKSLRRAVRLVSSRARRIPEPRFMAQRERLTGPAAGLAGIWESYSRLAPRGWQLTDANLTTIASGRTSVAAFARANSSLYIDAIYDAHFNLSLLGKSLLDGYRKLGGPGAFGSKLTQSEVDALAAAYSIEAVRLHPHPGPAAEAQ